MLAKIKKLLTNNRSVGQTVFKNTFWLVLSEIYDKLLLFVLVIWIARSLGDANYGIYSFVFAFVTLFSVFADMGLSTLVIRDIARAKNKINFYFQNIIVLKIILGLITLAILALIINLLGKDKEVVQLVYIAAFYIIFTSFSNLFYSVFRSFEKMELEAVLKIIYTTILFVLALLVLLTNNNLYWLVGSYTLASFIAMMVGGLLVRKFAHLKLAFDKEFIIYLLREAWPYALSIIFISIYYYIDSVMLSVIKSDEVVGWYNAAYKPIMFIILLSGMVLNSTLPVVAKLYKISLAKLGNFLQHFVRFMLIIAIPISLGGTILASGIMNFLYKGMYQPGVLAFQILIWTAGIIYLSVNYANALQGTNKQRMYLFATALGAIVNIIFNVILIPKYSLYGAAAATLLAELAVFIIIYFQVNKFVSVKIKRFLFKPLLSGIIMALIIYPLRNFNLFLVILIGAAVYITSLFLIKGINRSDLEKIKADLFDIKNE